MAVNYIDLVGNTFKDRLFQCLSMSSRCKLVKVYGLLFNAKSQNSSIPILFDKPRTFTTKKALLVNLFRKKKARYQLPLDLAPAAIFLFRYWVHKSFLDRLHFPLEM